MLSKSIAKFYADESGVSLVEYCLIAALIAVGAIAALGEVGDSLIGTLEEISTEIGGAGG